VAFRRGPLFWPELSNTSPLEVSCLPILPFGVYSVTNYALVVLNKACIHESLVECNLPHLDVSVPINLRHRIAVMVDRQISWTATGRYSSDVDDAIIAADRPILKYPHSLGFTSWAVLADQGPGVAPALPLSPRSLPG